LPDVFVLLFSTFLLIVLCVCFVCIKATHKPAIFVDFNFGSFSKDDFDPIKKKELKEQEIKVKELKTKNDVKEVKEVKEMNDTNGKQNKKNKKNKKKNNKETTQPTTSAHLPTTGSKNSASSYSPKSTTSTIKEHNSSTRPKDTRPHVPVETKTSASAASSIYCSREWLISYNSKYAQKTHDEDIHALSCHPESFEIVMSKLFNAIDPPGAPGMVAKMDPPAPPGMTPKY